MGMEYFHYCKQLIIKLRSNVCADFLLNCSPLFLGFKGFQLIHFVTAPALYYYILTTHVPCRVFVWLPAPAAKTNFRKKRGVSFPFFFSFSLLNWFMMQEFLPFFLVGDNAFLLILFFQNYRCILDKPVHLQIQFKPILLLKWFIISPPSICVALLCGLTRFSHF